MCINPFVNRILIWSNFWTYKELMTQSMFPLKSHRWVPCNYLFIFTTSLLIFFHKRQLLLSSHYVSDVTHTTYRNLPQDGYLSPFLFNICVIHTVRKLRRPFYTSNKCIRLKYRSIKINSIFYPQLSWLFIF